MTFTSQLQWFKLFHDGPVSLQRLEQAHAGLSTRAPCPAEYTFDTDQQSSDQDSLHRVMGGLSLLASRLAKDVDSRLSVYNWLVDDDDRAGKDRRLVADKTRVCAMIGAHFKAVGFRRAMELYG